MRKKYAASCFLVLCSICFLTLTTFFTLRFMNPAQTVETQNVQPPEYEFILQEHEGKIAVYRNPAHDLVEVLNIYVNTLPNLDVQRLQQGIHVKDSDQLLRYIHDFDS